MKLHYAHIENFKGVKDVEIDFVQKGQSRPSLIHAILGDNGSGKTTMLQAVALTLSLATRHVFNPLHFVWNGFLAERLATLGPPRVELRVEFDDDEIDATREAFRRLKKQTKQTPANSRQNEPGDAKVVTIVYEMRHVDCPEGPRGLLQFQGRHYVNQLLQMEPDAISLRERIGDVFWYDQYRNIGTVGIDELTGKRRKRESWAGGVDELRENLVGWWAYHASPTKDPDRDYIAGIEKHFNRVFPETRFQGVSPMATANGKGASDFYFLLEREGKTFDVAEMSSGEQAIFPLICDFVRLGVKKSIVLIDELELHLHPPEQQTLLSNLVRIGPECQFVLSTHSNFVEGALVPSQVTRLPGGRLCL